MKLEDVVTIFITTVEELMSTRLSNNSRIYVETKAGSLINFRPASFRKKIEVLAGNKEDVTKLMEYFRQLNWIRVEQQNRFTNIQWINRKSVRVISVYRDVLEGLKELSKKEP